MPDLVDLDGFEVACSGPSRDGPHPELWCTTCTYPWNHVPLDLADDPTHPTLAELVRAARVHLTQPSHLRPTDGGGGTDPT